MTDLTQTLDRLEALWNNPPATEIIHDLAMLPASRRSDDQVDEALNACVGWIDGVQDELPTLIASVRAMLAEREGMRVALKPFAKCCEDWIGAEEDDEEWAKFRLLISDYRRAFKALPPPPEKEA